MSNGRLDRSSSIRFLGLLVLVAGLLPAAGCAINPATGKRQLMLYSESDEVALGLENDRQMVTSLGLYPDEELQAYVQRLGTELAAKSERPQLDWTFRVVDDPVVNAFALPGGYIYITRGILAYFNNEAELSSVIGHEIGHVTARHSMNQMSKSQLANAGLGVGMAVLNDDLRPYGALLGQGAGLLFLKFSRDDERQADELGLRYLVRGGYDPRPMPNVYAMLGNVAAAAGASAVPSLLSTHPAPDNRRESIESQIAELDQDFSGRPVNRDALFARLDNLVFGEDPRAGYFEDELFLHPDLEFRYEFPEGWNTSNQVAAVAGMSPEKDALVQLSLADEETASAALTAFLANEGVTEGTEWLEQIHGHPCASRRFRAVDGETALQGLIAFVEYGDRVFQLLGLTTKEQYPARVEALARSISSFNRLTDPVALAVQPSRLKIVRIDRAMDLEELARRHDASVGVDELALLNQLPLDARLTAGESYKIVVGGP